VGGRGEGIPRVHTVSVAVSGQRSVIVCTSECLVISCCNMEKKIFSDEEVVEQIKPASMKAYKKCWKEFREISWSGWSGRGAARRPWRAAGGCPPAVESDLGPSAGRGERPGAVRRPWRAA
jgi:hypothetical protein